MLPRRIFVVYPTYAELLLISRLLPVVCIVVLTLTRFIERNFLSFGEGKSVFEIMRQYRQAAGLLAGIRLWSGVSSSGGHALRGGRDGWRFSRFSR